MVACPICGKTVKESDINSHIDSDCREFIEVAAPSGTQANGVKPPTAKTSTFFTPTAKKIGSFSEHAALHTWTSQLDSSPQTSATKSSSTAPTPITGIKRAADHHEDEETNDGKKRPEVAKPVPKKQKNSHAPLAERMRPRSLDEVAGQEIVGPNGVLRDLIITNRVPSMILWGEPGTGKTTIARLIAQTAGTRFVEINSTSSGVAECKKLFAEAKNELALTGRHTIIFCDEIHRFSKSQQDVFLGPVEAGDIVLVGATTENPSFKVINALLSRCRTFTLSKLSDEDVFGILKQALAREVPELPTPSPSPSAEEQGEEPDESLSSPKPSYNLLTKHDYSLLHYLAAFADGDARTGLNLLELSLDLCQKSSVTTDDIKKSLTQTLVYDRAGDQHYDTISAFHKSVRGSDADAALYYLARMLQSGESPLYIARRMVVIASEDVGLADNNMLSLATATYTAAEKIGMPECRINLAHCTVALCLAKKSTRAYRALNSAYSAISEPGVAGLPIPLHIRNAPTRLMKEMSYGKDYKYNPDYKDGRVAQDYLPERLEGRKFLGSNDLGDKVDPEIEEMDDQIRLAEQNDSVECILLNPDGD